MISQDIIPKLSRRKSLSLIGGMTAVTMTPFASCANPPESPVQSLSGYNLDDPKDKLQLFEKLGGDLSGKKVFSLSKGRVFGIRPDLPSDLNGFGKEVLRFTGCSMRIKRVLDNGNVETKSRSWLLYQDPLTGEFLSEYKNPYTEEVVEVKPFIGGISGGIMTPNGPEVKANFSMESTVFGKPIDLVIETIGDRVHISRHAFTKWLEKKSNTYRTEMTLDTFDFDKKYLDDKSHTHIPCDTHWTSQTSWLSMLNMKDTPGHMLWTTSSNVLFDKANLPTTFVNATMEKEPNIFTEPMTWDS